MSEVESKNILRSKTFWFNALTIIGTVLAAPVLPAALIPWIPTAQALVNIGLRVVSDQPVTILPK